MSSSVSNTHSSNKDDGIKDHDTDGTDCTDKITEGAENISSDGIILIDAVDIDRVKSTPALAAFTAPTDIKQKDGDLPTSASASASPSPSAASALADVPQGGKVENYSALSKKEKIECILQQIRLTLGKKDYVCAHIIGDKIDRKALGQEGMESYRVHFYELMAEYHLHEKDAYELSKDYHAIYSTHIRAMDNSRINGIENTGKEETKDSGCISSEENQVNKENEENEEKWMSALRATVLFLALSPRTPEQSDILHRISTDANLQKVEVCHDIVHTLLQKRAALNPLPHPSNMELWNVYATANASDSDSNSNFNFNSTSATMDNDICIMEGTNVNVSGEDDTHNSQHTCIEGGVFSGGMIARIGRRFTTSVLGMEEQKPFLALPIRSDVHEGVEEKSAKFGRRSNGGGWSDDGGELLGSATRHIAYGLPISVLNREEEKHKNDRKGDAGIIAIDNGQAGKPQIFMKRKIGTNCHEKRLRHQSLPYIPTSFHDTPIIELPGLYESYGSPDTSRLCNETNISSSQHSVPQQMESSPIIAHATNNYDNSSDANQHLPHKHLHERPPPQRNQSISSRPSVCATIPLRSPQQSLWLENAMQYEKKGNYTSALYYYELYLVQLRDNNNDTIHCHHHEPVPLDCVGEVQNREHIRTAFSLAIEMAWLLHKVGVVRWKTGEYDKSLSPLLEATISLRRFYLSSSCGSENRRVYGVGLVEVLNSMGRIYLSRGECEQARMFFEESYDILSTVHTQSIPNVGPVGINNHRKGETKKENHDIIGSCELESSKVMRNGAQDDGNGTIMHPSMAKTIIAIGMIDNMQGKFNRALQTCRRGYYIQCKILCPDHVDIAATLNVIGIIHGKMGNFTKALKYHKKALRIYTQQVGNDHVDVAVTQNNIGEIYHSVGNYTKSMAAFKESLRVMKGILGNSHRNVAASQHNIALVHMACGELDEALSIFKNVLRSQRKALGDDHMDVALTLESIGYAYERKGRLDRGIKLYQKALRIRRTAYGKSHLYVAFTLDRIGKSLMSHGKDLKEAMRRFHEALNLYHHNGLLNEDERIVLARTNLQKIRNNLKLDAKVREGDERRKCK